MSARKDKDQIISRLLLKPGIRPRVDAHCVQCIYDEQAIGTYKQQVWGCLVDQCVFHSVRLRPRGTPLQDIAREAL